MTIILSFLAFPHPAYAACTPGPSGINIGECFGYGNIPSFGEATSKLIGPMFSLMTAIVVLYFLWGALNYLKSGGNKEEVAAARGTITHAIIGFIILILAFLILQFLLSSLFNITSLQIIK